MNTTASNLPRTSRLRLTRAQAIQLSFRTFATGLLSVLPLIGALPALYAMICWSRVRLGFYPEWNPARRYLLIGLGVAIFGFLANLLLISSIVISARDF